MTVYKRVFANLVVWFLSKVNGGCQGLLTDYCCCGGNAVFLIFLAFACLVNGVELHFTGGLGLCSRVVSTAYVCVEWQDD
jgi:hypothetical protein